MDALTPAGRLFGPSGHERRLSPAGLPDYSAGAAGHSVSNPRRDNRGSPGCQRIYARLDRFRRSLEVSPAHTDRIEFTATTHAGSSMFRTGRSRSAALHPASRRRSYGSIPHGSLPHRSGLLPLYPLALSGARARASCAHWSASRRPADQTAQFTVGLVSRDTRAIGGATIVAPGTVALPFSTASSRLRFSGPASPTSSIRQAKEMQGKAYLPDATV